MRRAPRPSLSLGFYPRLVGLPSLLLLVAATLGSCHWPQWPDGVCEIQAYIPYVESITAPQTTHVGEPVDIALTFSTALVPGLLDDPHMVWDLAMGDGTYGRDTTHYIREFDPRGRTPSPMGLPGNRIAFTTGFGAQDVGSVTLRFGTTASRDQGGTKVRMTWGGSAPYTFFSCDQPPFTYREVVINVLP